MVIASTVYIRRSVVIDSAAVGREVSRSAGGREEKGGGDLMPPRYNRSDRLGRS